MSAKVVGGKPVQSISEVSTELGFCGFPFALSLLALLLYVFT